MRAKNDCKTAECDEDLNIPGQHSLNQPNSLNNTPCQKGYVTLHISLGEDRCFCVASEELRDSSSVLISRHTSWSTGSNTGSRSQSTSRGASHIVSIASHMIDQLSGKLKLK